MLRLAGVKPGLAIGQVDRLFIPDRRGVEHGIVVDVANARQIGRYGITNQVGHGGFSNVYEVLSG
ncbi:hypothetical protein D3C71_2217030 [compost metagenome]